MDIADKKGQYKLYVPDLWLLYLSQFEKAAVPTWSFS
jgi:hypothetical protein